MSTFDVGIVGMGTAGATALLKLLQNHKNMKIAIFDAGRPSQKRRHQVFGFLGTMPGSDGKLYINDLSDVAQLTGQRKVNSSYKWALDQFANFSELKLTKDRKPSVSLQKKLTKFGYDYENNDYYQLLPKDIHAYSRFITAEMEKAKNVFSHFDDEVVKVEKTKSYFIIHTNDGEETHCKKLILSVGRGGWRWAAEVFNSFGIIEDNNTAKFGIRIETTTAQMKDFNKSNMTLRKGNIELGPLSWEGTVIPEDHLDMAITSYRSNEQRWKSDKVSFNLLAEQHIENFGWEQTDRIGKLTFILGNDRMLKERISLLMDGKSKISIMKEYNFLKKELEELDNIVPDIMERGYFYAPTLMPWAPKINIGKDLSTDVKNLFVAGETAGIPGILGALVSGSAVADAI